MQKWLLRYRGNFDLNLKIKLSIKRIEQFYEKHGACYISRGGLDSLVVSKLAKMSAYGDNIPNVCVASCEPTENVIFNKKDCTLLKSDMFLKDVIIKYGYPLISKDTACKISRYVRTKDPKQKDKKLNGYIGKDGKLVTAGKIPEKYKELIYAPFFFSERCCDYTKKKPLKKYEKENYCYPITGERVDESLLRRMQYLKQGCIHTGDRAKCTPIATWSEQDKLKFLYGDEIPTIYGEIVKKDDKYYLTGENRTGCEVCGFGVFNDVNRLYSLMKRKPKLFDNMMRGGEWKKGDIKRPVKFKPNGREVDCSIIWVPNKKGFGFALPLNYIFELLNMEHRIVEEKGLYIIKEVKQNEYIKQCKL